ncbi:MAG: serine/threonine protein kinase [Oscillospiraceae bacterium]|nr:serine/threonine protein kinase [Oscillospiraceae bacterium]
MVEINDKQLCENCFEEINTPFCTHCGYNAAANMSDPTMLAPGSVLLGKYIVGKVMGKGGFGVTYLAYDVTAGKKVAIKEFFPYGIALRATGTATVSVASMDNAEAFKAGAEKFYNEAKLVSKFNGNPNIVGVYEFFYENDTVYFAMEYLKGQTLKEYIGEHGTLSAPQALFIAQSVANALMAAHSSNVLHRDISPDNIIICDNGDVKLIDFGAARQVVAEHSQSFSVILKPGFAPLEQYQKKGNQGPWTDIYSLGATVYYALTEDIPDDPMSRLDDDEEFSSNRYNVNPELWRVISKATQLKIDDRYGDIFQLKNDLTTITIEPEPLVVPKESPADKMPEFQTAKPFGMTQMGAQQTQPVQQPVTVGAPVQPAAPAQPIQPAQSGQAISNGANAPAKNNKGKIIAVCSAAAVAVAAAIIIPIAVNNSTSSNNNPPIYNSSSEKTSSSKPEVIDESSSPSADIEPTYVTKRDWVDKFGSKGVYTGEWADGQPNGEGYAWFGNSGYEEGTFVDGIMREGTYMAVNSQTNYFFTSGSYDENGALSGKGYMEYCVSDAGDREFFFGTFKGDGQNPTSTLVEGIHVTLYNRGSATIQAGTYDSGGYYVYTGYAAILSSSTSFYEITKGSTKGTSITDTEFYEYMGKYDANIGSHSVTNHFGYSAIFDTIAANIAAKGGPGLKLS